MRCSTKIADALLSSLHYTLQLPTPVEMQVSVIVPVNSFLIIKEIWIVIYRIYSNQSMYYSEREYLGIAKILIWANVLPSLWIYRFFECLQNTMVSETEGLQGFQKYYGIL